VVLITSGYQCDNCNEFTRKPVKVQYPSTDKKLDYLGTEVKETDMQDDDPDREHYCRDCIEEMKESVEDDQNE